MLFITNVQKVLVVYFGIHFGTSCQEALDVLEDDDDILQAISEASGGGNDRLLLLCIVIWRLQ